MMYWRTWRPSILLSVFCFKLENHTEMQSITYLIISILFCHVCFSNIEGLEFVVEYLFKAEILYEVLFFFSSF